MIRLRRAKSWVIGLGTTGLYLLFAGNPAVAGSCTGACGACGFGCVGSLVPIVTAGGLVLAKKRKDLREKEMKGLSPNE